MSIVGQALLWAGFLSGSLATVFSLEIAEDKWATINWIWYGVSIVIGIAGIVILQQAKRDRTGKSEKSQASLKEIKGNLSDLIVSVESFDKEIKNMKPAQMLEYIEENLTDDFRMFADGRDSITSEHGLDVFAEVMTQFAAGERAVNRAWCASADGYVDEASDCIARAKIFLNEAKLLLDAAAKE